MHKRRPPRAADPDEEIESIEDDSDISVSNVSKKRNRGTRESTNTRGKRRRLDDDRKTPLPLTSGLFIPDTPEKISRTIRVPSTRVSSATDRVPETPLKHRRDDTPSGARSSAVDIARGTPFDDIMVSAPNPRRRVQTIPRLSSTLVLSNGDDVKNQRELHKSYVPYSVLSNSVIPQNLRDGIDNLEDIDKLCEDLLQSIWPTFDIYNVPFYSHDLMVQEMIDYTVINRMAYIWSIQKGEADPEFKSHFVAKNSTKFIIDDLISYIEYMQIKTTDPEDRDAWCALHWLRKKALYNGLITSKKRHIEDERRGIKDMMTVYPLYDEHMVSEILKKMGSLSLNDDNQLEDSIRKDIIVNEDYPFLALPDIVELIKITVVKQKDKYNKYSIYNRQFYPKGRTEKMFTNDLDNLILKYHGPGKIESSSEWYIFKMVAYLNPSGDEVVFTVLYYPGPSYIPTIPSKNAGYSFPYTKIIQLANDKYPKETQIYDDPSKVPKDPGQFSKFDWIAQYVWGYQYMEIGKQRTRVVDY